MELRIQSFGATSPGRRATGTIHLPAPTAWPFLMALGLTLVFASLVTSWPSAARRNSAFDRCSVGWFREVLPHEAHEELR